MSADVFTQERCDAFVRAHLAAFATNARDVAAVIQASAGCARLNAPTVRRCGAVKLCRSLRRLAAARSESRAIRLGADAYGRHRTALRAGDPDGAAYWQREADAWAVALDGMEAR